MQEKNLFERILGNIAFQTRLPCSHTVRFKGVNVLTRQEDPLMLSDRCASCRMGVALAVGTLLLTVVALPCFGYPDIATTPIASMEVIEVLHVEEPPVDDSTEASPLVPVADSVIDSDVVHSDDIGITTEQETLPPLATARDLRTRAAHDLIFLGMALIPTDARVMPGIQRISEGQRNITAAVMLDYLGTPQVLLPIIGSIYLTQEPYDKKSAEMAAVALLNAGIIAQVGKNLAGRARPDTPANHSGELTGSNKTGGFESFPSGHAAAAFAVATVLARRYPKQRIVCYGLASAVGLARLWRSSHFPSDVLVGAGVGVLSGENALRSGGQLFSIRW